MKCLNLILLKRPFLDLASDPDLACDPKLAFNPDLDSNPDLASNPNLNCNLPAAAVLPLLEKINANLAMLIYVGIVNIATALLIETSMVDEVVAELAVPDVQGLGLCTPGIGCELNAEAVGKFGLKGVQVGEVAHKFGLHPVPLFGHSGERLVEVVEPLVLCDTSMLAVSEETVYEFLCKGIYLEDVVALAGECGYDELGAAGSTTLCCGTSWIRHIVQI